MRRHALTLIGLVVVLTLVLGGLAAMAAGDEEEAAPCCFTNPNYTGVCTVYPAEGETCADILAYLNNPMSAGKTYCGGTKIRGGWTQVDCEGE